MNKKNIISTVFNISFYYVIIRFILFLTLSFSDYLDEINYNYSSHTLWYCIWYIIPFFIALLIALKFKLKIFSQVGLVLFITIFSGTIYSGFYNKNYWGYKYVRPTVFNELKDASKVYFIKSINKTKNELHFNIENWYNINNLTKEKGILYYKNSTRAILYLLNKDIEINTGNNEQPNKITDIILKEDILINCNYEYYKESCSRYDGFIIKFETNSSNIYYYIAFDSGEVENDHYPAYEFLINSNNPNKVLKTQMYYFDLAGKEGFEYSSVAPIAEFLILILVFIIIILIHFVVFYIRKNIKTTKLSKHLNSTP